MYLLVLQRYRICVEHASELSRDFNGVTMRFCQQCGRFHRMTEFDGQRKTCRRRLALHNAQRRRRRDLLRLLEQVSTPTATREERPKIPLEAFNYPFGGNFPVQWGNYPAFPAQHGFLQSGFWIDPGLIPSQAAFTMGVSNPPTSLAPSMRRHNPPKREQQQTADVPVVQTDRDNRMTNPDDFDINELLIAIERDGNEDPGLVSKDTVGGYSVDDDKSDNNVGGVDLSSALSVPLGSDDAILVPNTELEFLGNPDSDFINIPQPSGEKEDQGPSGS